MEYRSEILSIINFYIYKILCDINLEIYIFLREDGILLVTLKLEN